jgi:hypothetical protein
MSAVVLLAMAVFAIGCGSDSSTGETTGKEEVFFPRVKGPSREFLIEGGDNIVQSFGPEATVAEREQASRVIHPWMRARAAEDWAQDCKYLSRVYVRRLVNDALSVTEGRARNCPQALAYFKDSASGDLVNTLTGPIDSLVTRGHVGYAQWHGTKGRDWVLPMREEGGRWLVDIASPIDRNA